MADNTYTFRFFSNLNISSSSNYVVDLVSENMSLHAGDWIDVQLNNLPTVEFPWEMKDPHAVVNHEEMDQFMNAFLSYIATMSTSKNGPMCLLLPRWIYKRYLFVSTMDIMECPIVYIQKSSSATTRYRYIIRNKSTKEDVKDQWIAYYVPPENLLDSNVKAYIANYLRFRDLVLELAHVDHPDEPASVQRLKTVQVPYLTPLEYRSKSQSPFKRNLETLNTRKDLKGQSTGHYGRWLYNQLGTRKDNFLLLESGGGGDCLYYSLTRFLKLACHYRVGESDLDAMMHLRYDLVHCLTPCLKSIMTNDTKQELKDIQELNPTLFERLDKEHPIESLITTKTVYGQGLYTVLMTRHPLMVKYSIGVVLFTNSFFDRMLQMQESPRLQTEWYCPIFQLTEHYMPAVEFEKQGEDEYVRYAFTEEELITRFPKTHFGYTYSFRPSINRPELESKQRKSSKGDAVKGPDAKRVSSIRNSDVRPNSILVTDPTFVPFTDSLSKKEETKHRSKGQTQKDDWLAAMTSYTRRESVSVSDDAMKALANQLIQKGLVSGADQSTLNQYTETKSSPPRKKAKTEQKDEEPDLLDLANYLEEYFIKDQLSTKTTTTTKKKQSSKQKTGPKQQKQQASTQQTIKNNRLLARPSLDPAKVDWEEI